MGPVDLDITDEECIGRMRAGETALFEVLVDRYSRPLLAYVQRLTSAADAAEDLLQEVFIRVYRSAERFDVTRTFRPWIYRIATNVCRDFLRTRKETLSLDYTYEPGGGSLLQGLKSRFRGPADQMADRELVAELYASIEELPPGQRQAFLLFHFQNFSQEEISHAMGIPQGTVKSRLFHAYKKVFLSMKTKAHEWSEKIPILLISIFSFKST